MPHMEEASAEVRKSPRKALKRRVSAPDSAIRTDLIELAPNKEKAKALEDLLLERSKAANSIIARIRTEFLQGRKVSTEIWREAEGFSMAKGAVILQPLAAQAAGAFESHLGWLSNDFKKRALRIFRVLFARLEKNADLTAAEKTEKAGSYAAAKHELLAINAAKAWTRGEADRKVHRVVSGQKVPVTDAAFDKAKRIFLTIERGRNLPELTGLQIEHTRGGARMMDSNDRRVRGAPGGTIEEAAKGCFPHWIRIKTLEQTILVPARFHAGFHLRNRGELGKGAGGVGKSSFPVHPVGKKQLKHRKKRAGRISREAQQGKNNLNPSGIRPEQIESIGIVRSFPDGENSPASWHAALRTQMADCFAKTREEHSPLIDKLGIDFGIRNFLTLTEELDGSRHVGAGFLGKHAFPLLDEIERLQAKLQADGELSKGNAKAQGLPEPTVPTDSKKLRTLRKRLTGLLESFLGTAFNRIASEIKPACIVVEELDFRGADLSASMNRMLTNCGRAFLDRKLKDLHERLGIEILRVSPEWTSQECSGCGSVDSSNRKGENFLCLRCGHQEDADVNAAINIKNRPNLGHSYSALAKSKGSFAWETGGRPPTVPQADWTAMGSIRNKALYWDLQRRRKEVANGENGQGLPPGSESFQPPVQEVVQPGVGGMSPPTLI